MPHSPSAQAVREQLERAGVRWVLAQFTDLHGSAKGKLVPLAHLDDIVDPGAGFAGPSIWGTGLPRHGARSEYYGRAVLSTAQVLPWAPDTARVVCDGFVDGQPFEACARQTLKRAVARLQAAGWTLNVGIEPEFFLFKRAADGRLVPLDTQDTLDKPSYDLRSLERAPVASFTRSLAQALGQLGLDVLQIDHEDAPGQFELNYRYSDALLAADRFMLFKLAAHHIAEALGLVFSLMPKPFADRPGSGLHFHLSLQGAGGSGLSDDGRTLHATGRHALGGLLEHASALCALHAPTVNSYKRLVVGRSLSGTTWAPAHIGWGSNNRTMTARITAGRIEWRVPDGSTNVYLALAGVIHAMLDGMDRHLDPGAAVEDDVYTWPEALFFERGIKTLPQTLGAAIDAFEHNTRLRQALGDYVAGQFIDLKRMEWIEYCRQVSDWEWQRYGATG